MGQILYVTYKILKVIEVIMSGGLADRPEEDNSNVPYLNNSVDNIQLPMEKLLTHRVFKDQIQNINLEQAKELLEQLHLMYLGQSVLFIKLAKQEFLGNI